MSRELYRAGFSAISHAADETPETFGIIDGTMLALAAGPAVINIFNGKTTLFGRTNYLSSSLRSTVEGTGWKFSSLIPSLLGTCLV